MAGSVTTKHKVLLLPLCLFLVLTIVARISYSKHFHGLLCAARTFHRLASGDAGPTRKIESERDLVVMTEQNRTREDIAEKIIGIRSRLHLQHVQEEKMALENGIYDRRLMKKIKNQTKNLAGSDKMQVLPQAIIIGVRKCGTRALLEMLKTHPQIAASGPEVHFFDKYYDRGLEWYRQKMKPSTPAQITIEKTPSYYITETAPEHIHSMNRDTKLIVILRDPTMRVISDFTQIAARSVSKLAGKTFEETVMNMGRVQTSYKAVQISIYSNYIDRWLEFFPLNQILFVDGDKLITNPLPEMKKVEKFLGIADFISLSTFNYNATTGFYCLAGDLNSKCLSSSKGRKHPAVSAYVTKKLQDFFRPYNEELFRTIKRSFDWP